mmetsp:Transcript_97662/g.304261  ORF Transcript_97662/g.304261 Transcript_97662/m.304261 type:complete len:381 (-) Transcript_97662:41-1183(-)
MVWHPMGLVLLVLSLLSACTSSSAQDTPACVLSPGGKMLCCAANDFECVAKVQKAHGAPASAPPSVVEPQRPWLFGALHTFANATVWDRQSPFDVAVVGVPFGLEAGYEAPGMQLLRREAKRIPPYSIAYGVSLTDLLVVDGQDLLAGGSRRLEELEVAALPLFRTGRPVVALGGDQSISVPLLRAAHAVMGYFAVIHIDQDLATGTGSREQELGADTAMFWGAAEGLFDTRHSLHVAARGNLPSQQVELIDQEIGFQTLTVQDVVAAGIAGAVASIRARLTRRDGTFMPAYISLDLDVLDTIYFPSGEVGGLSVTELRALLAGLQPFCRVVGAEIRGVATLSDPSSVKIAAAVAHDLVLLAGRRIGSEVAPPPLTGAEL